MKKVVYPPCPKCGAAHGMGIEETATGKIEPIDLCYNCLWDGFQKHLETAIYAEWGGSARCMIDGESKNMADELNRLENALDK